MNHRSPLAARRSRGLPRWLDVAIAIIALVVSAPVLALAALAIKLDSRGPVLYLARRIGRDGAEFELYKLRTMHTGNDPVGVGTPVLAGDPRVTRVGEFLRRFSLDELPNLPAADPGRPGRRVHATSAAPPRGEARADRVGAGQRPR